MSLNLLERYGSPDEGMGKRQLMLAMAERSEPLYIDGHDRRLVNSVQACAIAGIGRSTLYLWIRLGKVEVTRTAGGQLRIFADTLFQRDPRGRKPTR